MKSIYKLVFSLAVSVFAVITFTVNTTSVEAFEVRQDKNLAKDELINGDLFISGEKIKIQGQVNGNLFVAAESVEISGDINGNVFAGGSKVSITGNVTKSVYVGGNDVVISGNVNRDLFLGANTATLNGTVFENVFVGGGSVELNNSIKENLYAGTGHISLSGTVNKDAFVYASNADIPKSKVKGNLNIRLEDKKNKEADKQDRQAIQAGMNVFSTLFNIAMFIGMYLVGLILFKYFPVYLRRISAEITESFAKDFGIGLIVLCAAPLVIFFVALTIIGIPFSILVFSILAALMFVNTIIMGEVVGKYIFKLAKKDVHFALELFVGMLTVTLLFAVPILGFFAKFISYTIVVGAVTSLKIDALKKK